MEACTARKIRHQTRCLQWCFAQKSRARTFLTRWPPSYPSASLTPLCPSPLGFTKWTTSLLSLKMFTSSMPGMVFTPRRFSVFCSLLSSVDVVLCTAFFFLRASARGGCGGGACRMVLVHGGRVCTGPPAAESPSTGATITIFNLVAARHERREGCGCHRILDVAPVRSVAVCVRATPFKSLPLELQLAHLLTEPLPPVLTAPAILASLSLSIVPYP